MNALMNETGIWFCEICDKTINFKSKSKHINLKTHKHKQKDGTLVKEYMFVKVNIDGGNDILNDTIKYCRKKFFHSFQFMCV